MVQHSSLGLQFFQPSLILLDRKCEYVKLIINLIFIKVSLRAHITDFAFYLIHVHGIEGQVLSTLFQMLSSEVLSSVAQACQILL